jgi:hypothetical protein
LLALGWWHEAERASARVAECRVRLENDSRERSHLRFASAKGGDCVRTLHVVIPTGVPLLRIILERTLDASDTRLKHTDELKGKLNLAISTPGIFSRTITDTLKELKNAKLIGDIVAHHSSVLLDESDIDSSRCLFASF